MGDITIRKALSDYKTVYMPYRNFAERTREEYLNDLGALVRFAEKSGVNRVGQLGLPIIERYVAGLEQRGFASLTRKRQVVAIRSFLLFLYQDGYIDTDVSARVVLPFTETTTPYILTQDECQQLRKICANNLRDAAILEVLLQTGVRLSELTRLTLNDVDWSSERDLGQKPAGFIRIVAGRGRKERVVSLDFSACLALRKYLATRKEDDKPTLFLNRFGEPFGERGVQKMLRTYFRKAGLGKASVHTLRHTFGAQRAATGIDTENLRVIMGNRDARSTSSYADLAKDLKAEERRRRVRQVH